MVNFLFELLYHMLIDIDTTFQTIQIYKTRQLESNYEYLPQNNMSKVYLIL